MATPGDKAIATNGNDQELVAAPGAREFIRVLHYHVSSASAGQVTLKSGTETKDSVFLTASGCVIMPEYNDGVFDCNPGENLNISGANLVGAVKYVIKGQPTV